MKTRRDYVSRYTQISTRIHIYCYESRRALHLDYCDLVEFYAIIRKRSHDLDELMYDDYDLDYTFCNDYNLDEDSYYEYGTSDLDEDYARDGQDYESLAYRHYA